MSRYRGSERFCRYTVSPLRKRKFVPGVEGEGTIVATPDPFYGFEHVNVTGITAQIEWDDEIDGLMAPQGIACSANVQVAGSRLFSSKPIDPWLHTHKRWVLTHADGSAVAYEDEVYSYNDKQVANPAVDSLKPLFSDIAWNHGDYKLELFAYGKRADGQALVAHDEVFFTLTKNNQIRTYFDPIAGDDTADGFCPHFITLANASYVESTRILSEVGAFTSLTLDGFPYDQHTADWIYLGSLDAWARIAEKIDNDNIRLHEKWSLGSDLTGITTDTGPKQNYIEQQPANNTAQFIKNGNTYDISNIKYFVNKTGCVSLCGYGSGTKAKLISSTIAAGSNSSLVKTGRQSTETLPHTLYMDMIDMDAQGIQVYCDRMSSDSSVGDKCRRMYGRVSYKGGTYTSQFQPTGQGSTATITHIKGVFVDHSQTEVGQSRRTAVLFKTLSPSVCRIAGLTITGDNVDTTFLDHYLYPDYDTDKNDLSWINTYGGINYGQGINLNANKINPVVVDKTVLFDCHLADTNYGMDGSNYDNNTDTNIFDRVYIAKFSAPNTRNGGIYNFAMKRVFATDVKISSIYGAPSRSGYMTASANPVYPDIDNWEVVIQRMDVFGIPAVLDGMATHKEFYSLRNLNETTDTPRGLTITLAGKDAGRAVVVKDSIFDIPNGTGNNYRLGGVDIDIAALNTEVGHTNEEASIVWVDPLNDQWDPVGPVFTDDFNRANENIDASANWVYVENSGTAISVVSNAASLLAFGVVAEARTADVTEANCYFKADITLSGRVSCLVVLRQSVTGDCYQMRVSNVTTATEAQYRIIFFKRVSGVTTELKTTADITMPAYPFGIEFQVDGNELRGYVNDVLIDSYTDASSPITDGGYGALRGFKQTEVRQVIWDNVEMGNL